MVFVNNILNIDKYKFNYNENIIPIFHFLFDEFMTDNVGNKTESIFIFFKNVFDTITLDSYFKLDSISKEELKIIEKFKIKMKDLKNNFEETLKLQKSIYKHQAKYNLIDKKILLRDNCEIFDGNDDFIFFKNNQIITSTFKSHSFNLISLSPIIKFIIDKIKIMLDNNYGFIPIGFYNSVKLNESSIIIFNDEIYNGHMVVLTFLKKENGLYDIRLFNSGLGSEQHIDNDILHPLLIINKNKEDSVNLILDFILIRNYYFFFKNSEEYELDFYYETINKYGFIQDKSFSYNPQKSGSCTFYSLYHSICYILNLSNQSLMKMFINNLLIFSYGNLKLFFTDNYNNQTFDIINFIKNEQDEEKKQIISEIFTNDWVKNFRESYYFYVKQSLINKLSFLTEHITYTDQEISSKNTNTKFLEDISNTNILKAIVCVKKIMLQSNLNFLNSYLRKILDLTSKTDYSFFNDLDVFFSNMFLQKIIINILLPIYDLDFEQLEPVEFFNLTNNLLNFLFNILSEVKIHTSFFLNKHKNIFNLPNLDKIYGKINIKSYQTISYELLLVLQLLFLKIIVSIIGEDNINKSKIRDKQKIIFYNSFYNLDEYFNNHILEEMCKFRKFLFDLDKFNFISKINKQNSTFKINITDYIKTKFALNFNLFEFLKKKFETIPEERINKMENIIIKFLFLQNYNKVIILGNNIIDVFSDLNNKNINYNVSSNSRIILTGNNLNVLKENNSYYITGNSHGYKYCRALSYKLNFDYKNNSNEYYSENVFLPHEIIKHLLNGDYLQANKLLSVNKKFYKTNLFGKSFSKNINLIYSQIYSHTGTTLDNFIMSDIDVDLILEISDQKDKFKLDFQNQILEQNLFLFLMNYIQYFNNDGLNYFNEEIDFILKNPNSKENFIFAKFLKVIISDNESILFLLNDINETNEYNLQLKKFYIYNFVSSLKKNTLNKILLKINDNNFKYSNKLKIINKQNKYKNTSINYIFELNNLNNYSKNVLKLFEVLSTNNLSYFKLLLNKDNNIFNDTNYYFSIIEKNQKYYIELNINDNSFILQDNNLIYPPIKDTFYFKNDNDLIIIISNDSYLFFTNFKFNNNPIFLYHFNVKYEVCYSENFFENMWVCDDQYSFLVQNNNTKYIAIFDTKNQLNTTCKFWNNKSEYKISAKENKILLFELKSNNLFVDLNENINKFLQRQNINGNFTLINFISNIYKNTNLNPINDNFVNSIFKKHTPEHLFSNFYSKQDDIYLNIPDFNYVFNKITKLELESLLKIEDEKTLEISHKNYKNDSDINKYYDFRNKLNFNSHSENLNKILDKIKSYSNNLIEEKENNNKILFNKIFNDFSYSYLYNFFRSFECLYNLLEINKIFELKDIIEKALQTDNFDDFNSFYTNVLNPVKVNFMERSTETFMISFVELSTNIITWNSQYDLIKKLTTGKEYTLSKVYQQIMGSGKSDVITPAVLIYNILVHYFKNYSIILPEHLKNQAIKNLKYNYSHIFSLVNFKMLELYINRKNNNKFNNKNITILSDLDFKNYLRTALQNINDRQNNKMLNFLSDDSFYIFDEFDSIFNPLSSDFNIPLKKYLFNELQISSDDLNNIINFCNNKHINFIENIKQHFGVIYEYLIKSEQNKKLYIEQLSIDDFKDFYKKYNLIKTSSYVFNLKINKDFGLPNINTHKNLFQAVPYSAANNPIPKSSFSSISITIITTILSFINNGLRIIDVKNILDNLHETYFKYYDIIKNNNIDNILEDPNLNLNRINFLIQNQKELDNYYKTIKQEKNNKIKKFSIIKSYLIKLIIPKLTFSTEIQTYSGLDIVSYPFTKSKVAFSGTTNLLLPYYTNKEIKEKIDYNMNTTITEFQTKLLQQGGFFENNYFQFYDVKFNPIDNGSIKSSILGFYEKNSVILLKEKKSELNILNELINIINTNNNIRCLIDVGAFFINTSIDTIINIMSFLLDKQKFNKLIYIDYENNKKIIDMNTKIDSEYKNTYHDKCFIFYSNKHIIGIDIKQPSVLTGLVTISKSSKLSETAQGIFRMRKMNYGHKATFVVKDDNLDTPEKILNIITNNEEKIKLFSNEKKKLEQNIKFRHKNQKINENLSIKNFEFKNNIPLYNIKFINEYDDKFLIINNDDYFENKILKELGEDLLFNQYIKFNNFISKYSQDNFNISYTFEVEQQTQTQTQTQLEFYDTYPKLTLTDLDINKYFNQLESYLNFKYFNIFFSPFLFEISNTVKINNNYYDQFYLIYVYTQNQKIINIITPSEYWMIKNLLENLIVDLDFDIYDSNLNLMHQNNKLLEKNYSLYLASILAGNNLSPEQILNFILSRTKIINKQLFNIEPDINLFFKNLGKKINFNDLIKKLINGTPRTNIIKILKIINDKQKKEEVEQFLNFFYDNLTLIDDNIKNLIYKSLKDIFIQIYKKYLKCENEILLGIFTENIYENFHDEDVDDELELKKSKTTYKNDNDNDNYDNNVNDEDDDNELQTKRSKNY